MATQSNYKMPPSVYYPSCVVNLSIRFDEALQVTTLTDPVSASKLVESNPVLGGVAPPTLTAFIGNVVAAAQRAKPVTRPLFMAKGPNSHVLNISPLSVDVQLPGYRQAATWEIKLAFKDFPFDPRVLRAVAAEIHMGTVPADNFGAGIRQVARGPRSSVIPTRRPDGQIADTLVTLGPMDDLTVDFNDKGSYVTMKGRDQRALLLDTFLDPRMVSVINLQRPINEVVVSILELHPMGEKFAVEVNPYEWPEGKVPSPAVSGDLTRVRLGAAGAGGVLSPPGDLNHLSYWDMITNYCYVVGAIPFFDGVVLRIRPARNLYDLRNRAGNDPRVKTPFAGGRLRTVGQDQLNIRRFVYGRDVNVKYSRKFTSITVPTVECVCTDVSSKNKGLNKLLVARWPAKSGVLNNAFGPIPGQVKDKVVDKAPTKNEPTANYMSPGAPVEQQVLVIPIYGVSSIDKLRGIAKDIYEEIGRGEMLGSASTNNLASYGGGNDDPDLLKLRPGDAVEFLVDAAALESRPPPISDLNADARMSFEQQVNAVAARLGAVPGLLATNDVVNLARALVGCARGEVTQLTRFFRVNTVHLKFDVSAGKNPIQVEFDFCNYVEARSGVTDVRPAGVGVIKRDTVPARPPPADLDTTIKLTPRSQEAIRAARSAAQKALSAIQKKGG